MKTHKMTNTRFYRIWKDMKTRCNNPNYRLYKDYGGRGITVCEAWSSFEAFKKDMFSTYSDSLFIDRINNDKGYSPENCRWVTRAENNRNRRMQKLSKQKVLEIRLRYKWGIGRALAKEYGVSPAVISEVVNKKRNYASCI